MYLESSKTKHELYVHAWGELHCKVNYITQILHVLLLHELVH